MAFNFSHRSRLRPESQFPGVVHIGALNVINKPFLQDVHEFDIDHERTRLVVFLELLSLRRKLIVNQLVLAELAVSPASQKCLLGREVLHGLIHKFVERSPVNSARLAALHCFVQIAGDFK
jgi:hypothetical protein